MNDAFKILFDPDDHICLTASPKGTRVFDIPEDTSEFQFFSINPIDGERDHAPTEKYHHERKPRRADANVTKFRNILLEIDDMPIDEQLEYISNTKLPFSTCVYSGSKSLHFIISLEQPLESKLDYDALVRRLHFALLHVDKSTKNPSRLSRVPNSIRDNGKKQDLLIVKKRIPLQDVLDWLEKQDVPQLDAYEPSTIVGRSLPVRAWSFFTWGAPQGEWNNQLYQAACAAAEAGYTIEEIESKVFKINCQLDSSDRSTIKSAVNRVKNDQMG